MKQESTYGCRIHNLLSEVEIKNRNIKDGCKRIARIIDEHAEMLNVIREIAETQIEYEECDSAWVVAQRAVEALENVDGLKKEQS